MAHAHTHPPLARPSLDSSKYPAINVFLKSLKRHARTLSALFAQHGTELAVLERLYYLNNNQHRPALFWQRIAEARRYSRRLRSLNVPSLVDGLRRSFYGDVTDVSSNLQKKGAWTHYPPAPTFKYFLVRLRTCNALLDKVRCAPYLTIPKAGSPFSLHRHACACALFISTHSPSLRLTPCVIKVAQHTHARDARWRISAARGHADRARRPPSSSLLGPASCAFHASGRMPAPPLQFTCT
ncbi:hypothetical protein BC827DRAFT_1124309 [Russula dissimulans]|nr:hypothetical protein BC827DRAFT_1124309 [Russula dissimulans]